MCVCVLVHVSVYRVCIGLLQFLISKHTHAHTQTGDHGGVQPQLWYHLLAVSQHLPDLGVGAVWEGGGAGGVRGCEGMMGEEIGFLYVI